MKLSIISVAVTTKSSAKGKPYQVAEVVYKNDGKVESKNITEYSKVFKAVADAQPGQVFDVASEKDDKGYWQWTSFVRVTGEQAAVSQNTAAATPSSKSNWETSEERAARQVLIVKQSCLSNAVNTLAAGAKTAPSTEQVLALAQVYTDWVLGTTKPDLFSQSNDISVE
jgi:hypothetical protein